MMSLNKSYVVEIEDVYKEFQLGQITVHALQGVSFKILNEEYISIMGPSGSGKTTLEKFLDNEKNHF